MKWLGSSSIALINLVLRISFLTNAMFLMSITIASLIKRLAAVLATKRLQACVSTNVVQHVALLVKLLFTHIAGEDLPHAPRLCTPFQRL